MRRSLCLTLLPAILLAACTEDRGAVYPVALDRARPMLAKTALPPVFGSNALDVRVQTHVPTEVVWVASQNGRELMRYIAKVSDEPPGKTRVKLDLQPAKGDIEKRFAENPSVKKLYLVAMQERIGSTLEGRAMDMSKLYPALGVAMVANMKNIRSSVDEAAAASAELDRSSKRR